MDLFEKINRAFGGWYEGLFGGSDDVRPKDVLRKILVALEEHRKEGFDNKVYVPNQYVLEIAVNDEEEKEYLLSFLDRDELQAAVTRYCQQNGYVVRGDLDFTIKEVEVSPETAREKVRVRCRYTPRSSSGREAPQPSRASAPPAPEEAPRPERTDEDFQTVHEMSSSTSSDLGTVPAVAPARLEITSPGKPPFEFPLLRSGIMIGRSSRAGNDVVLVGDGMASRRHARIERESDGRYTLYDLETTNGTRVNGHKVQNRVLEPGDEISVGQTRIVFHLDQESPSVPEARPQEPAQGARPAANGAGTIARLMLLDGSAVVDDYVLGSETIIGRGVTNDIVLHDRSVATRHARIRRGEPATLEVLDGEALTLLNGESVAPGTPVPLNAGDILALGTLALRYEEQAR